MQTKDFNAFVKLSNPLSYLLAIKPKSPDLTSISKALTIILLTLSGGSMY